jgi:hypothetical protein
VQAPAVSGHALRKRHQRLTGPAVEARGPVSRQGALKKHCMCKTGKNK